jgi:hypothetical protein
MTHTKRLPAGLVMIGLAALPGCPFIGPDCIHESRNVQLEATFEGGIRVYLSLDEERDAGSDHVTSRRMMWAVMGTLPGDELTGARLHRGEGGPLIATLPIENGREGVLTQGDEFEPSFLTLSYDEFFAVVRTQPVFVVLETSNHPAGMALGPVPVSFDNPWVHPYCS